MGDARKYKYPEIRAARFHYAIVWLPKKLSADYGLRQQWTVDRQQSDLPRRRTSRAVPRRVEEDHDYMKFTWPEYHYKHACRLGICPNYLFDRDKFGLSTATTVMHSCSVCYDPTLPNPFLFPTRL
eukprot:scaffold13167_cov123-Isochrysis_galbana.AAC.5